MPNQTDTPNLFNPFVMWADLGMRAAEAAVASAQNMTEGADRATRAVAGAETTEIAEASSAAEDSATTLWTAGLGGMASMQRLMWDLMAQNWNRWLSTVGTAASWTDEPARERSLSLLTSAAQGGRSRGRSSTSAEHHAFASDEAKPRRKPAAKPAAKSRRTRRTSGR